MMAILSDIMTAWRHDNWVYNIVKRSEQEINKKKKNEKTNF